MRWLLNDGSEECLAYASKVLDLLASVGCCIPKRMFGGFGSSIGGLTVAVLADLGGAGA